MNADRKDFCISVHLSSSAVPKALMLIIRPEMPSDRVAVRRVNELAFGRPNEVVLVDALRDIALPQLSLVAAQDEEIVGHIFFSPVRIESEGFAFTALGLGPMAVLPVCQNQGVGSALVRHGLDECLRHDHSVVVVLGHRHFYPRFGFAPASTKGLRCEFSVPDDVFMVTELTPGALAGRTGLVRYRPEFAGAPGKNPR
jgi:putative acetyltransferase